MRARIQIAFIGSAWYSAHGLKGLIGAGYAPAVVVTNPPRAQGRGHEVIENRVEQAARESGIPVFYDSREVLDKDLDFGLILGYGKIIKAEVLKELYLLNIHFSQLPKYRGPAPVEWTILNGDSTIGVSLLEVVEEVDAGPLYRVDVLDLSGEEYLSELQLRLTELGIAGFIDELKKGTDRGGPIGLGEPVAQEGEPSYAPKIKSEMLRLDFNESAEHVLRRIRLERAYCYLGKTRLNIGKARLFSSGGGKEPGELALEGKKVVVGCGDGAIELLKLTPEGRRTMDALSFANGLKGRERILLTPEPKEEEG